MSAHIEDVALLEGGVDSIHFCDFIERSILPAMMPFDGVNPRSILIMDKMHQSTMFTGCLWFLPVYSHNMNKIEEVFSHVKQSLKNSAAVYQSCENSNESLIQLSWRSRHLIVWHILNMLDIKLNLDYFTSTDLLYGM